MSRNHYNHPLEFNTSTAPTAIIVSFIFRQCMCEPGGIISDSPVAEKLLMTDLARWPPKE